jgi:hemolysin-activating ACP:hemolysin acyltransferase
MTGLGMDADRAKALLATLDPADVGAAASRLVAASIGDVVLVLSRSPAHKHYAIADIEWMVLPAVMTGQFYVAQAADKERGFRAPIAVATWAFVSEEVDRRLQEGLPHRVRLGPHEWRSGEISWIIDLVGAPVGVKHTLAWMRMGPFKNKAPKIIVRDGRGQAGVVAIDALANVEPTSGDAL